MSILIKGMEMEMPKNCWECEFNKSTFDRMDFCTLTNKQYNWGLSERPSDCPLIEVSEDVHPLLEYGEWTAEGNDEIGNYWDECTVCRRAVFFPPSVKNDYKYCPHCGARMGDEDDV